MSRPPFVRATLAVLALFLLPGVASAQLVTHEKKVAPVKQPASVMFASYVGEALDQKIAPDGLVNGLPTGLVRLIEAHYPGANGERLTAKYYVHAASFEARWNEYQTRLTEVNAAVSAAKASSKSGDHATAKSTLLAVLTPVSSDPQTGKVKHKRDTLERMDAEMAALIQLARIAVAADSPELLAGITTAFYVRRKVLDQQTERLMWLERAESRNFSGLGAGLKNGASRATSLVVAARHQAIEQGKSLARGFFNSLATYDLADGQLFAPQSAKKGQWALFKISQQRGVSRKITDSSITIKINKKWQEPYSCRETKKIDGYDPVSNRFIYRRQCKYKSKQVKGSMTAKLAAAPPKWTNQAFTIWVIGKVDRAGKNWKLSSAQAVDFRFLGIM